MQNNEICLGRKGPGNSSSLLWFHAHCAVQVLLIDVVVVIFVILVFDAALLVVVLVLLSSVSCSRSC